MAYEPTVWNTGDVISAEKLNKIENGVAAGGGLPVVHVDFTYSDGETVFMVRESYSELYEILGDKANIQVTINVDNRGASHLGEIYMLDNTIRVQFSIVDTTDLNDPRMWVYVIIILQDGTQSCN